MGLNKGARDSAPVTCSDAVIGGSVSLVCPGGGVEDAEALPLWNFVPLSPFPLCWFPLRYQHSGRGDLYRSGLVGAAHLPGSAAGASRWLAFQRQGLRPEGGGSGGSSRRCRRGRPDSRLELHGDHPRSTFHIGIASPEAEHSIDSQSRSTAMVCLQFLGVQAACLLLSRRNLTDIGKDRQPWLRWSLGTPKGFFVIFFPWGSSLLLFLDSCSVSKFRVVSASVCSVSLFQ
jgi:hypothetical protein